MFAAINKAVTLVVNFGVGQTGKTIGYTLKNGDGTTFQARTTTGVSELQAGSGIYKVEVASSVFTAAFDGYVIWDVANAAPYASEDIFISDRIDATISSRSTYAGADTSGTTTLLSRLTSTRAGNLDNLDATISGIPAAVWAFLTSAISTAGSIGKLLKDNIDAAISSRSTYAGADTAGTTTLLSRLTSGRATNLDNLDHASSDLDTELDALTTAVAALPTAASIATAVWAAATRTLTAISDSSGVTTLLSRLTSGRAANLDNLDHASSDLDAELDALTTSVAALPSASSIATAVWAAATRTLTAISDSAGITTLLGRLTSTRAGLLDNLDAAVSTRAQPSDVPAASAVADAVWDEALSGHTTAGSAGKELDTAATGADPSTIADAVWDEALAGHTTLGTAGKDLASAGAAGDPWAIELPGAYTGDEAGAILPAIKAKTDLVTTGTEITLVAPVLASGKVVLVQGDDYKNADGRALQWSSDAWPVLTSGTVTLYLEKKSDGAAFSKVGTVVSASSARVDLTAAETTAREVGAYRYALKATLSDGDVVTLATGELIVEEKP